MIFVYTSFFIIYRNFRHTFLYFYAIIPPVTKEKEEILCFLEKLLEIYILMYV